MSLISAPIISWLDKPRLRPCPMPATSSQPLQPQDSNSSSPLSITRPSPERRATVRSITACDQQLCVPHCPLEGQSSSGTPRPFYLPLDERLKDHCSSAPPNCLRKGPHAKVSLLVIHLSHLRIALTMLCQYYTPPASLLFHIWN